MKQILQQELNLLAAAAVLAACRLPTPMRAEAGASGEPKWNQVFPIGTFHNGGWPDEGITIDAKYCETMVANWVKRGKPRLQVDYLHRGGDHEEVADLPVEEKIASGWMVDLEVRDDGLWALIKWTDRAREYIAADELSGLSPEWHRNGIDGLTGQPQGPTLIGAGLVNRPAFQELPRVAAAAVPPAAPAVEDTTMKNLMIAALAKAGITIAADATDEAVLAAYSKLQVDTVKASAASRDEEALKAKAAAEASEKTLKAQLAEAIEEKAKLGVRVANIEKAAMDVGIAALQKRAIDEGRMVAAAQEQIREVALASGLEKATKFVDAFPKGTVPVGEKGIAGAGASEGQAGALKQLQAAASELEKAGTKPSEALRAAARANPELAAQAFPSATTTKAPAARS